MGRGLRQKLRFARDHRWVPRRASEYLEGDLDPRGRERVERHTRDCPECDELVRELEAMVAALGGMRGSAGADVAVAVLAGVQGRLDEETRP